MRAANLALRFVLELCAGAAVAYWAWTGVQPLASVVTVALVAVVWGTFVAPKRRVDLAHPARFAIEVALWLAAALALAAAVNPLLGVAFGVVAVASGVLTYLD